MLTHGAAAGEKQRGCSSWASCECVEWEEERESFLDGLGVLVGCLVGRPLKLLSLKAGFLVVCLGDLLKICDTPIE